MAERILIIDDDARLSAMVSDYLAAAGFAVERRQTAQEGLAAVMRAAPDAVILDLMLPDLDGFEVCRRLRRANPHADRARRGHRPHRRPRARRRRLPRQAVQPARTARAHPRDPAATHRAAPGRQRAALRPACHRPRRPRRARRRRSQGADQLSIRSAGGPRRARRPCAQPRPAARPRQGRGTRGLRSLDRSIDVHVSRIRAAIEDDPKHPRRIITVRGSGYVFAKTQDQEP